MSGEAGSLTKVRWIGRSYPVEEKSDKNYPGMRLMPGQNNDLNIEQSYVLALYNIIMSGHF